jgi:hypothetical protein
VTNNFLLKKLNSQSILTPYFHNSETGGNAGVEILGGLYNLKLPASEFNKKGIYTLYIKPAEIRTTITDCGVLSALPNVKGIIINLNEVPAQYRNKFTNQGLVGFRIEYLNNDGSKIPNFYRIVTSSFFCEPVVTEQVNSSQKTIRYRYVDGGSDLVFCTLSPCFECAKLIIQSGIKHVYFIEKYRDESGLELLKKSNVNTEQIQIC